MRRQKNGECDVREQYWWVNKTDEAGEWRGTVEECVKERGQSMIDLRDMTNDGPLEWRKFVRGCMTETCQPGYPSNVNDAELTT